jgi:hypothetical protein
MKRQNLKIHETSTPVLKIHTPNPNCQKPPQENFKFGQPKRLLFIPNFFNLIPNFSFRPQFSRFCKQQETRDRLKNSSPEGWGGGKLGGLYR